MNFISMGKMLGILGIMMLCTGVGASYSGLTEAELMARMEYMSKNYPHIMDPHYTSLIPSERFRELFPKGFNYEEHNIQPTEPSSRSFHEGSSTGKTLSNYEESEMQTTQASSESSRESSATEALYRDYDASQIDESEYAQADEPQADQPGRHPIRIGSIRGVPGINFPDYTDIPLTSFSCSDKAHIPGFYADMETGCQVFHVCWPHRRESFLCPIGTTFNQPILTCDYWYSSNCSLASHYYGKTSTSFQSGADYKKDSMVDSLLGKDRFVHTGASKSYDSDLSHILKFLPVKAKVFTYRSTTETKSNTFAEVIVGRSKEPKIPEELKPQYTSAPPPIQRKEARSPKIVAAKIKSKNDGIDPIDRIINEVLNIAKNILNKLVYLPRQSSMETNKGQKSVVRKRTPLPELNPRFITKPAEKPRQDIRYERPTRPTDETSYDMEHKSPVISPLTKKILTENYLKMLKLRH